jgi:hypothetical protein
MKFATEMFEFTKKGRTVAFIQAESKKQARGRTQLINHIVCIPKDCKVRAVERIVLGTGPVFFDEHLRALEDVIEQGCAGA